MKNKMRFKVAVDLCIQERMKFFLSVLGMIAFFCVLIHTLYMTALTSGYRDRVQESLKVPIGQVGYCFFEYPTKELAEAVHDIPEITNFGYISTALTNNFPKLRFLKERQRGHQKTMSDSVYDYYGGVEVVVMSKDLWDVMNIRLVEGTAPFETEVVEAPESGLSNRNLLYLSEDYKGLVNVGDVFEERTETKLGEVLQWYAVAGFIDRDSLVTDEMVFSTENLGKEGYYLLDYGIIEMPIDSDEYKGFFVYADDASFADVKRKIMAAADDCGANAEVYNISSVVQYASDKVKRDTAQLNEAAVMIAIALLLGISGIQIFEILTKTKDYGVWLASGASKKDLIFFIVCQNLIRAVIATVISIPLMMLIIHTIYGTTAETHRMINRLFAGKIPAYTVLAGLALVAASSVIPSVMITGNTAVNLIKGKIFE